MKAVLINHSKPGSLEVDDTAAPQQYATETLVSVKAFSLNRGELLRAHAQEDGTQIGWDFSGTVEDTASDGSGPPKGARVEERCCMGLQIVRALNSASPILFLRGQAVSKASIYSGNRNSNLALRGSPGSVDWSVLAGSTAKST